MPQFKPTPSLASLKASSKPDSARIAFLHDLLNEMAGLARAGRHDFLAYLIGMARMEAARLARRDGE